jgi:hypothetical protein
MSWVERLSIELIARGVPRRERAQIVLELEDHIACEQGCEERLGDPRELATGFAEQLATSRARVTAFRAFWALALAAVALALSQLAIGHTGGYPGFTSGLSLVLFVPALLGLFVAPQVALVAGSLAVLRAVRRRHERSLPAAEIELIERRTRVALLAGLGTVAGLGCYVLDFVLVLPGWYLMLIGGSAAVAGAALLSATGGLRATAAIVSRHPGPAGDVYDDLPVPGRRWLRRHPVVARRDRDRGPGDDRGHRSGLCRAIARRRAPARHPRGSDRAHWVRAVRQRYRVVHETVGRLRRAVN